MTLKASLVAKVVTKLDDKKLKIGTAYPIRQNVVITAYHAIPDITQYQNTQIKWIQGELTSPITKILYESKTHDVVIAECQTPPDIPVIDISVSPPGSSEHWDSYGFPDAGIDDLKKVRAKTPAGGQYLLQSDESCEMHLVVGSDAAETQLWRGMSGAPVFTSGTNRLTGIICQVPDNENPGFKNRIYATSLSQLMMMEQKEAQEGNPLKHAIVGNLQCDDYLKQQQALLTKELGNVAKDSTEYYTAIAKQWNKDANVSAESLSQLLVNDLSEASGSCIEKLRLASEAHIKAHREQAEILLLSLLACRAQIDTWDGDSLHQLSVRKRLLCELKLANRYGVNPVLARIGKEVAGKHAIHDHSSKEVGFDPKANAVEQAKSIAYYLYKKFDDDFDLDEMDQDEWDGLDVELKSRREGDFAELIRFELNMRKDAEHPLADEVVRRELYQLLPSLPIALYGEKAEVNENTITAQVRVFYERLEQLG